MEVLLENCDWVLTQDENRRVLRKTSVLVKDGLIEAIGRGLKGGDLVVSGEGKVLMPGLINTHTHLSMTLLRGYAEDLPLDEWLRERIWPVERKLTGRLCYIGALLGCLEMIRTGTTCVVDMYYHAGEVARAVHESCLRGFIGQGMIDVAGSGEVRISNEPLRKDFLNATYKAVESIRGLGDPRVKPIIAPHAPYTCSDELLAEAMLLAERLDTLVHIHLAETRREQALFQKTYGCTVVEYLDKLGFLTPRVLAAHCVWLTKHDVRVLAERGVKVSHCPISNMKLGVGGVAPIPEMLEFGVAVSLGTDGAASNNTLDMFETMKFAALLQKHSRWDPAVFKAQQILDMATVSAAEALGLQGRVGCVKEGLEADLILVNLKTPSLQPIHGPESLVANLIYSAKGLNVDTVLVQGKPLMVEKTVETLDPEAVYSLAEEGLEELGIKA